MRGLFLNVMKATGAVALPLMAVQTLPADPPTGTTHAQTCTKKAAEAAFFVADKTDYSDSMISSDSSTFCSGDTSWPPTFATILPFVSTMKVVRSAKP